MGSEYKLELKNITKNFPGVKALDSVNLSVRPGTVHAIVGENGAGKSTLMKVLNGSYIPNEGEIWIDGVKQDIKSPADAEKLGIAMIWQELQFVPHLTVMENFYLNRLPVKKPFNTIDWKTIRENASKIIEEEGLGFHTDTLLTELSISDIQLMEIIKAISRDAKIIIMDEPTSSLSQGETDRLFEKIRKLRSQGVTIIYISHKMDEIYALSDYVTIMRDGHTIETRPTSEIDPDEIIAMMVGRKIDSIYPTRKTKPGDVVLEVKNLTHGDVYQNISFHVRKGEIVGFAGLVGAGRTEIMRGICAFDPHDSGEVLLDGEEINVTTVASTVRSGIMMATEDRRRYGLISCRDIKENISIASLQLQKEPYIKLAEESSRTTNYFNRMRVKAPGLDTLTYTLSGGNQQKVVLAKWMMAHPKVFIMDEPTRGIDVGAKYEIYNLMNEMAEEEMGIIMISSELPELIGMCDRIYIVCEGKISGELSSEEFSQTAIMKRATGGK